MKDLKLHANGKNIHRNEILKELKAKVDSIMGNVFLNSEERKIQIKKVKEKYARKIEGLDHNLY